MWFEWPSWLQRVQTLDHLERCESGDHEQTGSSMSSPPLALKRPEGLQHLDPSSRKEVGE
jgi:hypothetical protein